MPGWVSGDGRLAKKHPAKRQETEGLVPNAPVNQDSALSLQGWSILDQSSLGGLPLHIKALKIVERHELFLGRVGAMTPCADRPAFQVKGTSLSEASVEQSELKLPDRLRRMSEEVLSWHAARTCGSESL